MGVDDNAAAVRDFVERAWNGGDETVFTEHLAPEFTFPGGPEGFKEMVFVFRAAFAGFRLEVHEMFGAGDRVVTRFTISGTHEGQFMGIAPTAGPCRSTGSQSTGCATACASRARRSSIASAPWSNSAPPPDECRLDSAFRN